MSRVFPFPPTKLLILVRDKGDPHWVTGVMGMVQGRELPGGRGDNGWTGKILLLEGWNRMIGDND